MSDTSVYSPKLRLDSSGNSYAVNNGVIRKISPQGKILWEKIISGGTYDTMDVSSSGEIVLGGKQDVVESSTFVTKFVVARIDTNGSLLWQKYYRTVSTNSTSGTYLNSIRFNSSDLSIYFSGTYDIYVPNTSQWAWAVLVKLDSSGNIIWNRRFTNPWGYSTYGGPVSVDSSGNVFWSGRYDPSTLYGYYSFVSKFDSSGTLQWQKNMYGPDTTQANKYFWIHASTVDSSGNLHVSGWIDPGGFQYGTGCPYFAGIDTSGNVIYQKYAISPNILSTGGGSSRVMDMVLDGTSIYAHSWGTDGSANNTYADHIFKYNTSGVLQYQREFSTGESTIGYGISVFGNFLYRLGYTWSGKSYFTKFPKDGLNVSKKYSFFGFVWQHIASNWTYGNSPTTVASGPLGSDSGGNVAVQTSGLTTLTLSNSSTTMDLRSI
jgi:hypothetical protein